MEVHNAEDQSSREWIICVRHNQNRVLVADEVGMEKTLIARGAIVKTARLRIEEKDDLFKVIYICSNQNIANQNIRKLDVTGKNAIGSVSDTRLSMQHLKISEQENDPQIKAVSYTHLTLPTKLEV